MTLNSLSLSLHFPESENPGLRHPAGIHDAAAKTQGFGHACQALYTPGYTQPCNHLMSQSVSSRGLSAPSDRYRHLHRGHLSQGIHRFTVVCQSLMKPAPVTTATRLLFGLPSKIQWLSADPFWYQTDHRASTEAVAQDFPLTFLI